MKTYAIIRVRGGAETSRQVEDTLKMLSLTRVNHCVLRKESDSLEGMLRKASGYITWGEASTESIEKLKRKGEGKVLRLHPPSKGYRSVKKHFPKGDLGYRGDKINELLGRMV